MVFLIQSSQNRDAARKHYCKLAHQAHDSLSTIEQEIGNMHDGEGKDDPDGRTWGA